MKTQTALYVREDGVIAIGEWPVEPDVTDYGDGEYLTPLEMYTYDMDDYYEALKEAIEKAVECADQERVYLLLRKHHMPESASLFQPEKGKVYPIPGVSYEVMECIEGCKNFDKGAVLILECHDNGCQHKLAYIIPEASPVIKEEEKEIPKLDSLLKVLSDSDLREPFIYHNQELITQLQKYLPKEEPEDQEELWKEVDLIYGGPMENKNFDDIIEEWQKKFTIIRR